MGFEPGIDSEIQVSRRSDAGASKAGLAM